jgi:hypothetical protein
MTMITVIGRGHSGTRAMSHTLSASGVFMGELLNQSGDLLPPGAMYDACRVFARYVQWQQGNGSPTGEWDWDVVYAMDPPLEFIALIENYLTTVLTSESEYKGWKIPETTLVFPWIIRMFPEAKYIYWIRNPRDCIIGRHKTDDLRDFGITYPLTDNVTLQRAISWWYQYSLVKATPKPSNWIEVRFEDFVLRQDATLEKLEDFLCLKLARIPVNPEAVDRWKQIALHEDETRQTSYYDFLAPAMQEYGYDIGKNSTVQEVSACNVCVSLG